MSDGDYQVEEVVTEHPVVDCESPVMRHTENLGQLAAALSQAQGEMPTVSHNRKARITTKKGAVYEFTYADLAACWEACRAPLSKAKLAVMQWPEMYRKADGDGRMRDRIRYVMMLVHESGEWIRGELPIVIPDAATAQDLGILISYARRYLLWGLVGVTSEDDEEHVAKVAEDAAQSEKQGTRRREPTEREPRRTGIDARLHATEPDKLKNAVRAVWDHDFLSDHADHFFEVSSKDLTDEQVRSLAKHVLVWEDQGDGKMEWARADISEKAAKCPVCSGRSQKMAADAAAAEKGGDS